MSPTAQEELNFQNQGDEPVEGQEPETDQPSGPTPEELQAQIADMQRQMAATQQQIQLEAERRRHAEERAQWLSEQAQKHQTAQQQEEFQIDDSVDPLDYLSADDLQSRQKIWKVIDARARHHAKEIAMQIAQDVTNQKVNEISRGQQDLEGYFQRIPELRDPNSEIFQLSGKYGRQMKADPEYAGMSDTRIVEQAILRAENELLRAGKLGSNASQEPAAQTDYAAQQRAAYQRSQQPSMGKRPAVKPPTPGGVPPGTTPEQLAQIDAICAKVGMTREQYFKAQANVTRFR